MADILIDLAAEFTGKKAFNKAGSATDDLTKRVKKLAKTLGVAYSAQQVLTFGKASVQAAAADEKAQKQLALSLKNVGLGRDAATSEAYIQRLQSEFGVVDDLLRPAYQTLAVATRDTDEAQKLLNLSLDISASTGKDLSTVTAALSKAYLGNNTSLQKLGVGISKADLKAKSFEDIVSQLSTTFAGAATNAAKTFQGSIDRLGVASANVKEIIGTGLIDALTNLGEDDSIADLAKNMENAALYTADVIRGIGVLTEKLKSLPGVSNFNVGMIPIIGSYLEILRGLGKVTKELDYTAASSATAFEKGFGASAKLVKNSKVLTAEELKQLKAKQLKLAIDKANLALGKSSSVFDLDKIQLAAAEKNQVEQLGKVTSQAQLLAITNDLARLRVKQDILALEDAIASGDVKAIESATAKLNADTKILGALTGQDLKLKEIQSTLEKIVPADLINLDNLNEAIRLLGVISAGNIANAAGSNAFTPTQQSIAQVIGARVGTEISGATDPRVTYGGQRIDSAGNYTGFNAEMLGMTSGGSTASTPVSITVNTGIGDPNAIAEAITQVVREAQQRGTLTGAMGTL